MHVDASERSADRAPFAALLYDASSLPTLVDFEREVARGSAFSLSHSPDAAEGWAEVLRDGLTFDLHGLAGGPPQSLPELKAGVGIGVDRLADMAALTLAPGPHLAGARKFLPVIRVAANLLIELARIGPATAIAWLPAKLLVRIDLFERAVRPWLDGGPFPAPAFVALQAGGSGSLRTEGLNFFIEQEFVLQSGPEFDPALLPRVAIRLIDWLVAHGPVSITTEAVLAGTGAVFLEVQDKGLILARCD